MFTRPSVSLTQIRSFLTASSCIAVALQRASGKVVVLNPFDADPIQLRRFRGLKAIPVAIHTTAVVMVPGANEPSAIRIL